jgi:hypothetical protein
MNMPWTRKTGLAQAAAVFATLTLVCLGLCGVNFVAVVSTLNQGAPHGWQVYLDNILTAAGLIELVGLGVGVLGLFVVAVASMSRAIQRRGSEPKDGE